MPKPPSDGADPDFAREIAGIKSTYADFFRQGLTKTLWAPFTPDEVGVRTQQVRMFSEFLRGAGRLHLEGMRILDLGCGTGRHLRQFIDMGAAPEDVFGIDIDENTLARARRVSPNLHFALGNGSTIDLPNQSFDLVTHHYVFSSVPSNALRRQLASEMLRVLRPGALIFWWDILHLAVAGQTSVALDVRDLFPGAILAERKVSLHPPPAAALRPCRGLSRLLAPLLDRMSHRPCRQAALIGKG
ncbi:MAG: methyltransferase domain-containing protein [Terrimicrobiaceae bacterium]|nr:methyltransferase domain-containing protein [Terrimicrobiaceae bacterium]